MDLGTHIQSITVPQTQVITVEKKRSGQIKDFTGISSPFDIPKNADIILENNDYKKCAKEIYNKIIDRIRV